MKTIKVLIARTIVYLAAMAVVGSFVYFFYIKPFQEIQTEGLGEDILLFMILTGLYTVAFFCIKVIIALVAWAVDNTE